jgi:hypothetical protein
MVTVSDQQLDALFNSAVELAEKALEGQTLLTRVIDDDLDETRERANIASQRAADLLNYIALELPSHQAAQILELRARLTEAAGDDRAAGGRSLWEAAAAARLDDDPLGE